MVSYAMQSMEIRIYFFSADTRIALFINSWLGSHRAEPNRYQTKTSSFYKTIILYLVLFRARVDALDCPQSILFLLNYQLHKMIFCLLLYLAWHSGPVFS